jgi:hypothetical protein
MRNNAKNLGFRGASIAAIFISTLSLQAVSIFPGTTLSPSVFEPLPTGVTVVNTLSTPFASATLAGNLLTRIYNNDSSNPWGTDKLTFVYQLTLSDELTDAATRFTVSSFSGFHTDVSYDNSASPTSILPIDFTRSTGVGAVAGFDFGVTGISPGQTSALLIVQTDAIDYKLTLAGVIDGSVASPHSFAPLAVPNIPEPGSSFILMAGISTLLALHRRSSRLI